MAAGPASMIPAAVEDDDARCGVPDDGKVVGDKEVAEAKLVLEAAAAG